MAPFVKIAHRPFEETVMFGALDGAEVLNLLS
jgi:hypothetical protein